jgi:hypothetical protein
MSLQQCIEEKVVKKGAVPRVVIAGSPWNVFNIPTEMEDTSWTNSLS